MTGAAPASEPPGRAAHGPRRAPAGTTVLFGLLVSTVLVTGSIIYMFLWGIVVPTNGARMATAMQTCWGRERQFMHPVTEADLTRSADAVQRVRQCLRPIYAEQVSWAMYCTAALFTVAVLIYWAYPLWFVRRRRLTPIVREDCPELADELERLSRAAGLHRAPVFLLAPYASTFVGLGLGLLALTGLMYLTRNAILRVREIQADARVGEGEGDRPAAALRAVVDGLTRPGRWRAALGTHPHPARRMRAIDDPATMLSPRLWELFAAGLATSMIAVNLRHLLTQALPTTFLIGSVATAMFCVLGMVLPLVTAVWRATVRAPAHRLPVRVILPMPVVLVGGYLLGEQLSWLSTLLGWTTLVTGGVEQPLVAAVLMLAGAVTLAVWTASVAHTVLGHGDRRWALPAVAAAGTVAFFPWFGVWVATHDVPGLLGLTPGEPPPPRQSPPGWYALLVHWAEMNSPALLEVIESPLTLPALALLWLVPITVVARRRRSPEGRPYRIEGALVTGLAGAAGFAVAGVALVYVLRAALPVSVRQDLDHFPTAVYSGFVALAVVAEALVAATVGARARCHRPVLIPLAVFTTGFLATGITQLGLNTAGRCVDLYATRPPACFKLPDAGFTAGMLNIMLVEGVAVAVPAALLGALLQALITRLRRSGAPRPTRQDAHEGRTEVRPGRVVGGEV